MNIKQFIVKHRRLLGYLVAIISSFIISALSHNGLVLFDMFILFAILRIAVLQFNLSGVERSIFTYMFSHKDEDSEDHDVLEDDVVDVLTDSYSRPKKEIVDILSQTEIGNLKHPLLINNIIEKSKFRLELTFLLWVIAISIIFIIISAVPFLGEFLDWVGGYE